MNEKFLFTPATMSVIKKLLLEIKISDATGEYFGVPAAQLEQWIHEFALHLEENVSMQDNVSEQHYDAKLSTEEIHFLLTGDSYRGPELPNATV